MSVEIRTVELDRWPDFIRTVFSSFGAQPKDQDIEDSRLEFEPGRSVAAWDGDLIVGTTSVVSLRMTVPGGGQVPVSGVTTVGVAPTHRRRGVLRQMMRRQLDDSREFGDTVAALWASEAAIYQRFGYGMATRQTGGRVPRARTAWLVPPDPDPGMVRLLPFDDAMKELAPVYERVRAVVPGMLERNHDWWGHRFRHLDSEHHREGFGPMFFALHEGPDGPDAYAVYRVKLVEEDGIDAGVVQVVEASTTTPDSAVRMWSYLFGIDLVETIEFWNRPPDDPLFLALLDMRQLRLRIIDGMWARLIDVPAALSARRYGIEGRVVFELEDEFCPWNTGRYELIGGPDGAECQSTDGDPELSLSARELGAVYLGGTRLRDLFRAGRVRELKPGAVARADAIFVGEREPWCPHQF